MADTKKTDPITKFCMDHPVEVMIGLCTVGSYLTYKLCEHCIYKGVLKANKKSIEYLSWVNNQIIY